MSCLSNYSRKYFLQLDVPTLVAFRRVNRRATALVESLHQFRRVMDHCADVIRAIVAIKASSFTFNALCDTLGIRDCTKCGRFGGYLCLIMCDRVCYSCFFLGAPYLPMTEAEARRVGLSKNLWDQLPQVFTLPGWYSAHKNFSKKRMKLLDRAAIQQRAQDTRCTARVRRHIDHTTQEAKRYMPIISAPYLGLDHDVDWGVHCPGCIDISDPARHPRSKHSQTAILDHLKHHGPLQKISWRMQHVQQQSI